MDKTAVSKYNAVLSEEILDGLTGRLKGVFSDASERLYSKREVRELLMHVNKMITEAAILAPPLVHAMHDVHDSMEKKSGLKKSGLQISCAKLECPSPRDP